MRFVSFGMIEICSVAMRLKSIDSAISRSRSNLRRSFVKVSVPEKSFNLTFPRLVSRWRAPRGANAGKKFDRRTTAQERREIREMIFVTI